MLTIFNRCISFISMHRNCIYFGCHNLRASSKQCSLLVWFIVNFLLSFYIVLRDSLWQKVLKDSLSIYCLLCQESGGHNHCHFSILKLLGDHQRHIYIWWSLSPIPLDPPASIPLGRIQCCPQTPLLVKGGTLTGSTKPIWVHCTLAAPILVTLSTSH